MAKYIPETQVGTTLARLTLDAETSEIVEAWKRMGINKTTMLILCAWYVVNTEAELDTAYERDDFVSYGVNTPNPLLVRIDGFAKTYGMSRSEFWCRCVRTAVRDAQNGVMVPLSGLFPVPMTVEEIEATMNKEEDHG